MSIFTQTASNKGGDFEAPPAGSVTGILRAIIDLGTQEDIFQGKTTKSRKVYLCWELPEEKQSNGQPHIIGRAYTCSLNEKAALRKLIQAWSGRELKEGESFDIKKLLGKACALTITHNDKGFAKIEAVAPLHKSIPVPKPTLPEITFEIGTGPIPTATWIPWSYGEPIQDIIKRSPEWKASQAPGQSAPSITGMSPAPSQDPDEAPF